MIEWGGKIQNQNVYALVIQASCSQLTTFLEPCLHWIVFHTTPVQFALESQGILEHAIECTHLIKDSQAGKPHWNWQGSSERMLLQLCDVETPLRWTTGSLKEVSSAVIDLPTEQDSKEFKDSSTFGLKPQWSRLSSSMLITTKPDGRDEKLTTCRKLPVSAI